MISKSDIGKADRVEEKSLNTVDSINNEPGGYVPIYHDIEEICYGPDCGLPAIVRVLYCIRHKLLRDGMCEKIIGKLFIMDKTGLDSRQVERAVKELEKREVILVHRSRTGKIWNENSYQLNPKMFGDLYNWYKNNPTVRLYNGSQGRSYSRKGLPNLPVGIPPNLGGVPANLPVGVPANLPVGVPANLPVGRGRNLSELLAEIASNNPSSNNPKENNPSSEDLNFSETKKKRTQEEHARMVSEQLEKLREGSL